MNIVSFAFVGFFIATVLLYYVFPQKQRWIVLLLASIGFYLTFSIWGIFVLLGASLVSYFASIRIQKLKNEYATWLEANKASADRTVKKAKKEFYGKKQNRYVLLTVIFNLLLLFFFKYYGSVAGNINSLLNVKLWTAESLFITLGISYYSLMLISYVIDVSRDVVVAEKNPLKVLLFACFFLSIMQGPFNRYGDVMPQITENERPKLNYENTKFAIIRIVVGYIKKMCIADQVGIIASEIFSNYPNYHGFGIILGVICFAIQLYADFSGYMDIVIGIGRLIGIKIPENFRQPFFSKNIAEFWRKWHITLGLWLQDYVFYPLLKSRLFRNLAKFISSKTKSKFLRETPTYLAMLILWTLIGLWHGAGFNFVFGVGILQFIYIFTEMTTKPLTDKLKAKLKINDSKRWWKILQSIKCTMLMCFAWIFFNAASFADALHIVGNIFNGGSGISELIDNLFFADGAVLFDSKVIIWAFYIVATMVGLFTLDILHEKNVFINGKLAKMAYPVRLAVYLALIFSIIVFGAYGSQYVASNFIYFKF